MVRNGVFNCDFFHWCIGVTGGLFHWNLKFIPHGDFGQIPEIPGVHSSCFDLWLWNGRGLVVGVASTASAVVFAAGSPPCAGLVGVPGADSHRAPCGHQAAADLGVDVSDAGSSLVASFGEYGAVMTALEIGR